VSLTDLEKQQIKEMIERGDPLPVQFRATLFPNGALDQPAYDRATLFNRGFKQLLGAEWTTTHFAPKATIPPPSVQAAWPWRREIWTLHYVCCRSLRRAYCRFTTGEWNEWSDAQRELERLSYMTNALTAHNGMEDRIAQLANCFNVPAQDEKKIHFCSFFKDHPPAKLPETNARVARVRDNVDWKDTHNRGNTIKHRWTGEVISQLPAPQQIRQQVDLPHSVYVCYGTIQIEAGEVDRICESAQRSLNLLVDLATTLDGEIGWDSHFQISGASI